MGLCQSCLYQRIEARKAGLVVVGCLNGHKISPQPEQCKDWEEHPDGSRGVL